MSHVYVTSDWHFGHSGITDKFRTQFPSLEYMEDYILENMLERLTKRDILLCIGDMAFTRKGLDKIGNSGLPCKMILIRGNHDQLKTKKYMEVFAEIEGAYRYKKYWITHIPIHPTELRTKLNIHGHCHTGGPYENEGDTRYFNAILEYNDYKPVNMQVVGTIINDRYNKKYNNKMELQREREKHIRECDKVKGSV